VCACREIKRLLFPCRSALANRLIPFESQTGASKHYAFLEFDSLPVARIVAETMDNYLLTGHILRCKVIPKEDVHPELWVGANRKWRVVPRERVAKAEHNKVSRSLLALQSNILKILFSFI